MHMHYDTSMHHSNVLSSVYMCTCVQTVLFLVLGGVQVELRVPIIMHSHEAWYSLLRSTCPEDLPALTQSSSE